MRHNVVNNKFRMKTSHRIATFRNMTVSLIENGKIETTIDMYDIEIYTEYNKVLTGRVYPSTNAQANRIAKNTKTFELF